MRTVMFTIATAALAAAGAPALAQVQDRYSPGRPAAPAPNPAAADTARPEGVRARVWPERIAAASAPRPQRMLSWPGKVAGSAGEDARVQALSVAAPPEAAPRIAAYQLPEPRLPTIVTTYRAPAPAAPSPRADVSAPPPARAAAPAPTPDYLQPADLEAARQTASAPVRPAPLPTTIYQAPSRARLAPAADQASPGDPRPDPFARANTTVALPMAASAPQAAGPQVARSSDPRPDPIVAALAMPSTPAQPQAIRPAAAPVSGRYAAAGGGAAPRRYSVHRSFGQAPDPIQMPREFFEEGSVDLAEPPPPLPPRVNEKGKTAAQVKAAEARAADRRAASN